MRSSSKDTTSCVSIMLVPIIAKISSRTSHYTVASQASQGHRWGRGTRLQHADNTLFSIFDTGENWFQPLAILLTPLCVSDHIGSAPQNGKIVEDGGQFHAG